MRHFLIGPALLVAALAAGTRAQAPIEAPPPTGIIAGVVRDIAGQPMPGVSVMALPASGGTITGAKTGPDGRYQIDGVTPATYRVDFDLRGFDRVRRNRVAVKHGSVAMADVILPVSSICECVLYVPSVPVRPRSGVVFDTSGRPLPHARLEIVAADRREIAYTDAAGRFDVLLPNHPAWPLIVSDSGFQTRRIQASLAHVIPMAVRLEPGDIQSVPETETFELGCLCAVLFTHQGR